MADLTFYVEWLRANPFWGEVPDFDPESGGINAEILFLLEKPGPKTSEKGGGCGFISIDNDDPTAEAIIDFYRKAGLDRHRTLHWNVIPGWNGRIAFDGRELEAGVKALSDLIAFLPKLKTVVFVGKTALRARPLLEKLRPGLQFRTSAHPSPLVRRFNPAQWEAIPTQWAAAA
jgi:hypothetical protein